MLALQELYMLSAFVHTVSDGCSVDSETSEDLALWYCFMGLWKHSPRMSINTTNFLLSGNTQLQQQLRILTWEPAPARKNEKNASFQLADSYDATFSLGVFCFPFWVPFIFLRCHFFYFTCLLPIFWSQSFSLRCQFFTRGSLRFESQYFF